MKEFCTSVRESKQLIQNTAFDLIEKIFQIYFVPHKFVKRNAIIQHNEIFEDAHFIQQNMFFAINYKNIIIINIWCMSYDKY
jgi:hypothetical protein